MNRLLSIASIALVGIAACDTAPPVDNGGANPVDVEKASDKAAGKADQWGANDNPSIFTPDLTHLRHRPPRTGLISVGCEAHSGSRHYTT